MSFGPKISNLFGEHPDISLLQNHIKLVSDGYYIWGTWVYPIIALGRFGTFLTFPRVFDMIRI